MAKESKPRKNNPFIENYVDLQNKMDKAYKQLKKDINSKEDFKKIQKDYNEFVLLLGEINFLTKEAWRVQNKVKGSETYTLKK